MMGSNDDYFKCRRELTNIKNKFKRNVKAICMDKFIVFETIIDYVYNEYKDDYTLIPIIQNSEKLKEWIPFIDKERESKGYYRKIYSGQLETYGKPYNHIKTHYKIQYLVVTILSKQLDDILNELYNTCQTFIKMLDEIYDNEEISTFLFEVITIEKLLNVIEHPNKTLEFIIEWKLVVKQFCDELDIDDLSSSFDDLELSRRSYTPIMETDDLAILITSFKTILI